MAAIYDVRTYILILVTCFIIQRPKWYLGWRTEPPKHRYIAKVLVLYCTVLVRYLPRLEGVYGTHHMTLSRARPPDHGAGGRRDDRRVTKDVNESGMALIGVYNGHNSALCLNKSSR